MLGLLGLLHSRHHLHALHHLPLHGLLRSNGTSLIGSLHHFIHLLLHLLLSLGLHLHHDIVLYLLWSGLALVLDNDPSSYLLHHFHLFVHTCFHHCHLLSNFPSIRMSRNL
jgi:hypothetical protein